MFNAPRFFPTTQRLAAFLTTRWTAHAAIALAPSSPPSASASRSKPRAARCVHAASQPGAAQSKSTSASKALVIGIDTYTEKGWPPLRNAVADAKAVAAALEKHGFDVTPKFDLKASELEPTIRDFLIRQGADPDARLLLWFAGHGHTLTSPTEEGYLVPADAPAAEDDITFRSKALAMSQFSYLLTQARAKHVLAVFDSCFSGAAMDITRSAEITAPPEIAHVAGGKTRLLISSGDRAQKVSDDGTFRRLFIDAINGEVPRLGRNGWVTGQHIGIYLRDEMTALTARRATPQTPNVGFLNRAGFNRGDVVFAPLAGRSRRRSPSITCAQAAPKQVAIVPPAPPAPPLGPSKNPPVALAPVPPPTTPKGS